uniref:Uncharacterized protein n=1 Tax=Rhizophora mucronata TaxID=61149 RepID=A0A2P2QD07_RHIMU
MNNKEIPKL